MDSPSEIKQFKNLPKAKIPYHPSFECSKSGLFMYNPMIDANGDSYEGTTENIVEKARLGVTVSNKALKLAAAEWTAFKDDKLPSFYQKETNRILVRDNSSSIDYTSSLKDYFLLSFVCFISKAIMKDPVTTPEGNTYDRVPLLTHLQHSKTDPFSGRPLQETDLIPNKHLAALLQSIFKEAKRPILLTSKTQSNFVVIDNQLRGVSESLKAHQAKQFALVGKARKVKILWTLKLIRNLTALICGYLYLDMLKMSNKNLAAMQTGQGKESCSVGAHYSPSFHPFSLSTLLKALFVFFSEWTDTVLSQTQGPKLLPHHEIYSACRLYSEIWQCHIAWNHAKEDPAFLEELCENAGKVVCVQKLQDVKMLNVPAFQALVQTKYPNTFFMIRDNFPLHYAAAKRKFVDLQNLLLHTNADVNAENTYQMRPLTVFLLSQAIDKALHESQASQKPLLLNFDSLLKTFGLQSGMLKMVKPSDNIYHRVPAHVPNHAEDNLAILNLFLKYYVDLEAVDGSGMTPLQIAEHYQLPEMQAALKEALQTAPEKAALPAAGRSFSTEEGLYDYESPDPDNREEESPLPDDYGAEFEEASRPGF